MAGRYTAQHLYPNRSYPEANSGATHPYRTAAYDCQWSQRSYLFQFDSYQQRIQFDAANTSCCSDPVRPFDQKPQYAEQMNPPRVTDCDARVVVGGCNIIELTDAGKGPCGSFAGTGAQTGILIKCPSVCIDLVQAQAGQVVRGLYGQFEYVGDLGQDYQEFRYVPDSDYLSDAYSNCESITLVEMLCGELPVTITITAGPLKPNGCDCDCCGNLPVTGGLNTGSCVGESGGWSNRARCSGAQTTHHCSGQGEALDVYWIPGVPHTWEVGPNLFASDGWWALSGDPGWVGDGDYPVCCGLSGSGVGNRGCSEGDIVSGITFGTKQPQSWNIFAEYGELRPYYSGGGVSNFITIPYVTAVERHVSGYHACSWATKAALEISGWTGLDATYGALERLPVRLVRSLGNLAYDSDRNGQCCGFGHFDLHFNNGCDDVDDERIVIQRNATSGGATIGRAFRCNSGAGWVVQETTLYCSGIDETGWGSDSTPWSIPAPTTIDECNEVLGSGSGAFWDYGSLWGRGCQAAADPNCCYYSQNGVSGSGFRALLWQGMGTDKCCWEVPRVAGHYIRESGDCCPQKTGEEWN